MRRCVVVLAALVLASGLSGCGRILGQRYDNFTAYYNTYYNAKREFAREEEQLLETERPVEQDRYLTIFIEPDEQASGARGGGFAKAIEKGADLLREHPDSKWVDDALLLIGKAYFYQANFSGAEQKFREVIDLEEDRLEDEARLWLGRTLTAVERYEDAALALREGLDREGVRPEWADQMRLALAEVDVREGEWDEAIESLRAGLDGLRDDDLAARAAFLLGQVYETTGQPTEAAAAYDRALDHGPRYQLAYAAQRAHALTLGLSGEGERALEQLGRMRRDDKNLENLAEIELTRARVLAAVGRPDEARDLIRRLLYDQDPTLRVGAIRGRVHYRLAEVYRDGLRDYVRAAAHYDTAATAIPRQAGLADEQVTVQAIVDAPARAETFGSYARVVAEIAEMDSLLYLGSLDDDAFAEAIEEVRVQRERESRERERDLDRRRSEQGFVGGPGLEGFDDDVPRTPQPESGAAANAGFLNFRNPAQVQEELIAFQARWGDRPLAPNWRRAAAIGGSTLVEQGVTETLGDLPQTRTPDLAQDAFIDVSAIPRDAISQEQMRASRAAARYELGNVLFLSLSEADSASVLYRRVIDEDPDAPVAQRAYFALAEAQRALGNAVEAERLYNDVIERYPESRFAEQARLQLGLAPSYRIVAADSLGLAEAAYAEAHERWQAGAYAEALRAMLALSDQFPTTPAAARARLAAGALYTEWAAGNEEALLAPEPIVLAGSGFDPSDGPSIFEAPPTADARPAPPASPATAQIFTWVVASEPDSLAAAQIALDYRDQGFDARVVEARVADGASYRVTIGQFPGRAEAVASRSVLPDDVPSDAWVLALPVDAPAASSPPEPPVDQPPPSPPAVDSTRTAPVPADSVPVDSVSSAADSVIAGADSVVAVADSVQVPAESPWLAELYASIETDFPGTPFAARARVLRGALDTLLPDAAFDVGSATDSTAVAEQEVDDQLLRGDEPIELLKGTFSWSVLAATEREEAEVLLAYLAEDGYRTALYTEQKATGPVYHVIVGQFASSGEAEALRPALVTIPATEAYQLLPLQITGELEQPE